MQFLHSMSSYGRSGGRTAMKMATTAARSPAAKAIIAITNSKTTYSDTNFVATATNKISQRTFSSFDHINQIIPATTYVGTRNKIAPLRTLRPRPNPTVHQHPKIFTPQYAFLASHKYAGEGPDAEAKPLGNEATRKDKKLAEEAARPPGAGKKKKERLVILGCGWAAFRTLKDIDLSYYDVSVVSPRNHFLFTPLLASTSTGTLEFRSIVEPVRRARRSQDYHYFQAECTDIDLQNKTMKCVATVLPDAPTFEMQYDKIVIAVGMSVATYNIPGVAENALFLKELEHARKVRTKIIERFEAASYPNIPKEERERLLHFVIVGAGPTGVECAAELHDFIVEDVKHAFPEVWQYARITILEGSTEILTAFDQSLRDYTRKIFERENIALKTGVSVKEVGPDKVVLANGTEIPCGACIWTAGITARPFIKNLDVPKDPQNRILIDNYLRVKGMKDVYAMGDCSSFLGEALPATAQVAQQQGKYLAKLLNHHAAGRQRKPNPFIFHNQGMLAYVGERKAIANVYKSKMAGFWAWVVWRSAYLTKLLSVRNKVLVPFGWFKTTFFGRDITKF